MIVLLWPFIVLAGAGCMGIAMVHFSVLFGLSRPFGMQTEDVLWEGIFWIFIPFVLASYRTCRDFFYEQKSRWIWYPPPLKVILGGCPSWMYYLTYSVFIYAAVYWIVSIFAETLYLLELAISGIWMAVYSLFFSTMYAAVGVSTAQRQSG